MKKIFILFATVLFLASCSDDILDISPKDRIAEDAVWADEDLIKAYHTELYNVIPHGFNVQMQSKATDEVYATMSWGPGTIAQGTLTPDNVNDFFATWGGGCNLYVWDNAYEYIRKINVFMDQMAASEIDFEDKAMLIAEARFLRAYAYFMLIVRFDAVPIVDDVYELTSEFNFSRNTMDECVQYIEDDLSAAIPDLPEHYSASDSNFGRATQDVCQALLSRLYLYMASPLFNPSNDQQKWQKAADAAAALLNGNYSLFSDYTTLFNQPSGSANSELIFARNFSTTNSHSVAMNNLGRRWGAYGGWWASNGPSQNLVDDYDMLNGEPAFVEVDGVKTVNTASGYDPQDPYTDRDPRFDATIIHDGTLYHGAVHEMWVASDGNSWGYDSYKQSSDNPRGNYILKKFMPGDDIEISWQTPYTNPWIIFRLGEIYLNYAEAMFELGHEDVCREYMSMVRARVGMPEIPESVTGEDLRTRLYKERRVELAFEEHRYFDVRRWNVALDTENDPIYGMDIIKDVDTGEKSYSPVLLLERHFYEKMYFLPVGTDEIKKNNGSLEQTTGW
ncbi:RagB/SusD family nutrient uptake outer membrane protein [Mangrovibacterium diazotrophicum]|uniref:Putative outer membrane starch-binding protein n=1 Tax=Mangrovibacterium diazotrophicum TaxID=1261403 RepID=A0A419W4F3_9BACT|nr:RagB/SusD family nutrient uptake outer membrane protein [Mangrovibacterium diazotrophicum]RKD90327.1 putative outer membrane starch-binding protein [Mangrovibacterium diazotrophicum]